MTVIRQSFFCLKVLYYNFYMTKEVLGNIHSIESFGTVDGPGIRFVVFMQGCPMRCQYCHNPDTWAYDRNKQLTPTEIIEKYDKVKEFLKNGGLTVTGGEPLSQIEFVTDLFRLAKEENIHTAIDTSGILFNKTNTEKIDELLKYTDLVMLDIKHINDEKHRELTKHTNKNILDFAIYLSEKNIPMWVRYVVVPTLTDKEEDLIELGKFLSKLKNLKALDMLPYHNMAIPKYENLGIEYPLKNIMSADKTHILKVRDIILTEYKKQKNIKHNN